MVTVIKFSPSYGTLVKTDLFNQAELHLSNSTIKFRASTMQ